MTLAKERQNDRVWLRDDFRTIALDKFDEEASGAHFCIRRLTVASAIFEARTEGS